MHGCSTSMYAPCLAEEVSVGGRDGVLEDVGVASVELLAANEIFHSHRRVLDAKREVAPDDGVRQPVLGIVGAKEPAGAEGHVGSRARLQREREARAALRARVARQVIRKMGLPKIEIRRVGIGVVLESHRGVRRVIQLGDAVDPVRSVELDPVGGERRRKNAVVPVALSDHAPHVVGKRLVARHVIGRVVAEVEGAEARAEAADAEVELIGDAEVEVRHVELEPVASEAGLHVRREMLRDVDGDLHGRFQREPLERCPRARRLDRSGLTRHEVVVELGGPGEVALLVGVRRAAREKGRDRTREHGPEKDSRPHHGAPGGDDASCS